MPWFNSKKRGWYFVRIRRGVQQSTGDYAKHSHASEQVRQALAVKRQQQRLKSVGIKTGKFGDVGADRKCRCCGESVVGSPRRGLRFNCYMRYRRKIRLGQILDWEEIGYGEP